MRARDPNDERSRGCVVDLAGRLSDVGASAVGRPVPVAGATRGRTRRVRDLVQRCGGEHDLLWGSERAHRGSLGRPGTARFRFAFKVPRTVTHDRRLQRIAHRDVAELLRALRPLGDRVGPIQLQLPPSFGPADVDVLIAFVGGLPRSVTWSIELRHPGFFDGGAAHRRLDDTLGALGIGRVILDTRPLHAVAATSSAAAAERRNKPQLSIVVDQVGPSPIVRVIGADDPVVTFDGLMAWQSSIAEWLAEGRTPYLMVHQPENLDSPAIARRVHAALTEQIGGIQPLPLPPGQGSLW